MKRNVGLFSLLVLVLALPIGLYLVSEKTNFFQNAFGDKADIHVNASNVVGGKAESWRYLAQGGEEKGRQLLPVVDKVKALSPKYIRIDHVFDYYNIVNKSSDGNITYNWSEFDLIIKDITSTGAKPFIALSYMPPSISSTGQIVDNPSNWSDWQQVVKNTVEHVSGRGGLNITDVYYEVWNEPDLFGKYKMGGNKNYLELYTSSVRGANQARNVNSFKIGGPAITGFYENWLTKLITFSQENGVRLDFLSWHRYSKDMGKFEEDLSNAIRYGYELVITEIGPNSENDKVYDSNFSAIHLIATTALMEGKVDKLFSFEIKDGPGTEKYWGRWGILTNEKFGTPEIKPRYRAIQFLNNLNSGENLELTGNGSWVKAIAKKIGNKIAILVVNYDQHGKHIEAVPLKVDNLPWNSFNLKRRDFNGGVSDQRINIENGTWEMTLNMEANTATILELSE